MRWRSCGGINIELQASPIRIDVMQVADNMLVQRGGGRFDPVTAEVQWDRPSMLDTFQKNGWGGGVNAGIAHELGHAYADLLLGADRRTSDAWSLEFQNAAADGVGCRSKH